MRLPKAAYWGCGTGMMLSFLLAACANSPSDDLARAQTDLLRLEKQGAVAYLPEQVARAKDNLNIAREFIQRNRFESASRPLSRARAVLDSCAAALVLMRSSTQNSCEAQFARLQSGLDSLEALLQKMPRQSYLDQNRYDLHSMKLKEMRQQALSMRENLEQKDYLTGLEKGQLIERRLRKSLAAVCANSFQPVVAVSSDELN